MTADADTTQVPLISALYHHSTILGPPYVGEYTQDTGPFTCHPSYVLNFESETEREKGRVGPEETYILVGPDSPIEELSALSLD